MAGKQQAERPVIDQAISLRSQLGAMWEALRLSDQRRHLAWMSFGAVAVILGVAGGQLLLNRWNKPFYDAIERKDVGGFLTQLVVFAGIAALLLALGVAQTWLNQRVRLRLREAFTLDLIREWMKPQRAFRLANAGAIGVNPDQRMQQDAGHLADMTTGLAFGLVQSTLLLFSFVGVLWSLSSGFVFQYQGHAFAIPGYMVWAVFLYAASASVISWLVGRPLIDLNADRYAREADMRASMVRTNENIDAISLVGGEADARRRLELDLGALVKAIMRIYTVQIRLEWVTDGYGWITLVAPILVAAPMYFTSDMTFGGLMMAVGAFNQVHSSLRWFVNNIGAIADWRATLLRVSAYRLALVQSDKLHGRQRQIAFVEGKDDALAFDQLIVLSPTGATHPEEPKVRIKRGERVLIAGDPGAGKTLLFRSLARLWPWGSGKVVTPKGKALYFMPALPYLPPGALRDVLTYPGLARSISDEELKEVLAAVDLPELADSLDRNARWDRELNDAQQRLLGFAQLAVQRPAWVVMDETIDRLEPEQRALIYALIERRLQDSTIINLGRVLPKDKFFTRRLHLVHDVKAQPLPKPDLAEAEPAPA